MPQTRRSTEVPVRATRSQGSPVRTVPVAKNRITPKAAALNCEAKDDNGKPTRSSKDFTEKTESDGTTSETADKTKGDEKQSDEIPQGSPVLQQKTRKRLAAPQETESSSAKKSKTIASSENAVTTKTSASPQQTEVFSPRRSSRAVIPNSRFKDMEMLDTGKKKSEGKTIERANREKAAVKKVRVPAPRKMVKVTAQPKQEEEQEQPNHEVVMEEIVTEETPIDDLLSLPNTTETTSVPVSQQIIPVGDNQVIVMSNTPLLSMPGTSLLQIESNVGNFKSQDTNEAGSSPSITCQSVTDTEMQSENSNYVLKVDSTLYDPASLKKETFTIDQNVAHEEFRDNIDSEESVNVSVKSDLDRRAEPSVYVSVPAEPPRKPQVIVLKSSAASLKDLRIDTQKIDKDSHANLIPKLDDVNKTLIKEYWPGSVKPTAKSNIVVIGKDNVQKTPKRVLVTPTHTVKNEAVKRVRATEKASQNDEEINKLSNSFASNLARTTTKRVSEEENIETDLVVDNTRTVNVPVSNDSVLIKSEPESFDLVQTEVSNQSYMTPVSENSIITSSNEPYRVGVLQLDKTAETVTSALDPVRPCVVYVKAKPKVHLIASSSPTTKLRYDTIACKIVENEEKEESETQIPNIHEETVSEEIHTDKVKSEGLVLNADESCIELENNESVVDNDSFVYDTNHQVIDKEMEENSADTDDIVIPVLNNSQNADTVTQSDMPQDSLDEGSVRKICQVLPVDNLSLPQTNQVQTAIEYVVFGDKMIPIHKPLAKAHGRITTIAGKPPSWRQHGRVEVPGQEVNNGTGLVKKLSADVAQTTISSVLEQIDEKDVSPMVLSALESLQQGTTTVMAEEQTEGTEIQLAQSDDVSHIITEHGEQARVIHGYIDRPSDTIEPTQIVEISQDLFAKEVYGEVITVDPVTGEIIPVSLASSQPMIVGESNNTTIVMAESTIEDQPITTTDVAEVAAEGVHVSEITGHVVTSLPMQYEHSITDSGGQVDNQKGTDSEDTQTQSNELENQSQQNVNQSITISDQSVDNQSNQVNIQSSSEVCQPGSPVYLAKPMVMDENQADNGLSTDPKVTTHYFKDGSMTIRIEGNDTTQESNISKVTIPQIVKVKSTRPQVLKRYITIPGLGAPQVATQPKAPNYKRLTNVKINPAVGLKEIVQMPKEPEQAKSESQAKVAAGRAVSVATSTQTRTEMETQTEISDEEDVDEGEPVDEDIIVDEIQMIESASDNPTQEVRRTTKMTMGPDGSIQEYVVVSLPEGIEIKQPRARPQTQRDPVHDEVVTMGEDGMYICMDCDHKTEKKSNWYKHRRKHLGIRPHACTRCNYKAATSSNLKRHMQIHDDVRNFVCSICSLMFRQKIHLERHIKYKHQEKKVKCPLCDYLCTTENPDLKIHIRRRHMPHEGVGMTAFTCEECGLMTVSKKDLKQHMKFHKKGPELKLFCEYCSFVTDCESRLRRHMLIHTKEKPFQCGLCSYRASQKEHVLRHMRSQHDVEVERKPRKTLLGEEKGDKDKNKRTSVDSASEGSVSFKDLSDDSQDVDKTFEKSDYSSTDKIFACNHCSMKFSKLINLYKHLYAQHRQVMPDPADSDFQCVVCDFRTNNKKNLLVHMRKHNMQDHTPPSHVYSCVLCHYINPRRRNLFQHMKKKHGIEIVMKEDGSNCYVTSSVSSNVILGGQAGETQIKPLSEIITMEAIDDETQLQIVTEDGNTFQGEKISIDNIISVEDIANYASGSSEQHSPQASLVTSSLYQTVAEHEAAEAIQGLQALAQQPGVLETQTIDNDITTEIVTSEILSAEEVMSQEETLIEQVEDSGIQLSSEQINQLSSGDYVEINGEVYKVEIAQESNAK